MTTAAKAFSGGCQCGAVRYHTELGPPPGKVHYCHCRMCQRAVGNVFATLVPVLKEKLRWEGEPSVFRSSSVATRGFCGHCGTPLSMAYDQSRWMCVTLGSVDDPSALPPEIHFGVESKLPWLQIADDLPREATDEVRFPGMVNHQRPPE